MNDFKNAIIECVPNFSEGVNMDIIKQITNEIETVEGVQLLDVDPGKATNRTVVTFVGNPQAVVDAAFLAIKKAGELIDMRNHKGEHPRMGATDVCPLIPISGITAEEAIPFANQLAKRVAEELNIPTYLYEYAATADYRRNLADIRSGEYEGFAAKIVKPEWKPDYGNAIFNERSGATVIGVRDFLIAYNVNLNTTSTRRANSVAFDIREKGRQKTDEKGKVVKDEKGEAVWVPGLLKSVKAIGWFIEEYGIAQISMNLTNMHVTPLHVAFDTSCERATARGMRVTGSELVGLVPLDAILEAGKYFLRKQQRSVGVSEAELIKIAVKSLGLDELSPFDPQKKIIEYRLRDVAAKKLVNMTITGFALETASESPAPGGGSIAAYCGALGAALATMVANLSSHKKGWDSRWEEFSNHAENGQKLMAEMLDLVDEDTAAFNHIMAAFGLPKSNDAEKAARKAAIEAATINAIKVPFRTMELAAQSFDLIQAMAETGNPNSVSDAGVGALCARAAVKGAYLNVKINAQDLQDHAEVKPLVERADAMNADADKREQEIWNIVLGKMK
ncbi:glutamate formimidoyltransferase [Flavipsychrobacter stenotrophus]|uniref:Formimidoyltransferase-cyclodeaminase n=1 Tax=Flavipsychrobacter stenotrophus TaxID=2077091 RepID=A0A2S7SSG5_9BACT|nr:glutamate formimidoyltransferase [Flavipsychrobacter stenotrophus]PQJ09545.1 glutamate formimidoyltransferase [Flavipsychrobacter stenotrophus]